MPRDSDTPDSSEDSEQLDKTALLMDYQVSEVLEEKGTPFVSVLEPSDRPSRYRVDENHPVTLGRAPSCDIIVRDDRVSRSHCKLFLRDGSVHFEDMQSTNGVFLDGNRCEGGVLKPGHRLVIGRTIVKVEFRDEKEIRLDDEMFHAAITDPLTEIPNRKWFLERAREEIPFAVRHKQFLSLMMIDADHFKIINDSYGHQAGDHVLFELAQLLSNLRREEDILARYGGEEFILLLRSTDLPEALSFAERIRTKAEKRAFSFDGHSIRVTLSIGVCSRKGNAANSVDSMIHEADEALYKAKENGRNRVESSAE